MKIAIFVEGLTEMIFTESLIRNLCGSRGVTFELRKQHAGHLILMEIKENPEATTHILIVNCQSDGQVKSQIRDQYNSLVKSKYTHIIGLRDVYPLSISDIEKLMKMLDYGLPTKPIPCQMHLAVLETESWFLDEISHFERIDPILTVDNIKHAGFDLMHNHGKNWPHPAETLDTIYKIAKKRYRKKATHINRTISALSPEALYLNVRQRSESFNNFITALETTLFPN